MTKKEFTKHYNNILNCPSIGKYPAEKEGYLKNEIQQLADIDKISYQLALDKMYGIFLSQYLEFSHRYVWTDLDDSNFKDIKKVIINLLFLKRLEGKEHKDESMEY